MSKKTRIILAAALAVLLIVIIVTVVLTGNKPYTALYQDMTPSEIQEVTTYLQNNGITDYQVVNGTVMVPNSQHAALIAQLAQQGYPRDGSLYGSYWEHVGSMSTSSERATAFQIATQEKLETNIRTMTGVLDASVIITPGESRTYVLEDVSTEAKASVSLTLRSGYMLTDQQARGIRVMVSHAWSGMTIDSVAITDDIGNTYTDSSVSAGTLVELKRQLEESQSNYLRTQIKHLLDPIYGAENVNVAVNLTVDVSEKYRETTTYNQPEGSYENGGLIGHEMGTFVLTRDGYQLVGGVPGTTSDADIPTYVVDEAQGLEDGDSAYSSYERDNKIDETKEQVKVAPTVTDVSIALTINERANPEASINVEELRHHVAVAANIRGENLEDWVSVLIAPFPVEPVPETPAASGLIPQELLLPLMIGAAALLLLLVLLLVILSTRRKKKRQQEEEDQRIIEEQLNELGAAGVLGDLGIAAAGLNGEMVPPTTGADIMEINTEKSMELRKTVRQFVQNNPEVAALMLKSWLKGGDDDNG
ncbi:MAG: hypothetical protein HDT14_08555 [Oscillibacter sp.]|nr:hypothetical protein [Oscillibacter sp.]